MRRILLKLSGEALAGEKKTGFDEETVKGVALQVKQLMLPEEETSGEAVPAKTLTGLKLIRSVCWLRL